MLKSRLSICKSWWQGLFTRPVVTLKKKRPAWLHFEMLEDRTTPSAVPTVSEQVFLERLNDARANPTAYGTQIGVDLSYIAPSAPLAFDVRLIDAARKHSQEMNDNSYFGHTGSNGSAPWDRMAQEGYPWTGAAESIAAGYSTVEDALKGLIIDAGVPSLGHRNHLLANGASYQHREVGIGIVQNGSGPYHNYYTIDSGTTSDARPYLTGVVYQDLNNNQRYDANEGLGGATVSITGGSSVATWSTGGYSLRVSPGTYTVTVSGGGLAAPYSTTVTVGAANVRLNVISAAGPEISVLDGTTDLVDGSSTVDFGSTIANVPTSRTFTVRNAGTQTLTLANPITVPTGYSVTTGFGTLSLAPGATTTFTVQMNAVGNGTFTGQISFGNNDSNENPFNFNVTATVGNGGVTDSGFETPNIGSGSSAYRYNPTGSAWTFTGTAGLTGNSSAFTSGNPSAPQGTQVAFLQMTGNISQTFALVGGTYNLSFRAAQRGNQPSSQAVRVLIDGAQVGTITPSGTSYGTYTTGVFTVASGQHTLSFVGLNPNGGDNTAFLDQVAFNSVAVAPAVAVSDGGTAVANGGNVNFGTTPAGVPITKTFTITNTGTANLTLSAVNVGGAAFSLTSPPGSLSLAPNASTTFTVQFNWAFAGSFSGAVSFTTNDPNNPNVSFTLAGSTSVVNPGGLADGSFETPNIGSGSSAYRYNPTGSAWTFTGSAGLTGNGSAFTSGNPNAPQGSQVAFVQTTGSISQTFSLTAGTYTVSFNAAQRGNYQSSSQTVRVLIDGVAVGTITPSGASYASYSTGVFTVAAGAHTLTFVGLNPNGGDNTAFLDQVAFNSTVAAPALTVSESGTAVVSGGTTNFGTTLAGVPVTKTYTITNTGTANLTLGAVNVTGTGFTLTSPLGSSSLAPNASTTFTVQFSAASAGNFTGNVSFATNDPNNPSFNFNLSASVSAAVVLADGGFETPNVGSGGSAYRYNPTGSAWTFTGTSGLTGNNSGFTSGNPNAPQGSQAAFVQMTGSVSQTLNLAAGTYTVSFSAAQRANYQNSFQTVRVLIDGVAVGTITPSGTSYATYSTGAFTVAAGSHTLTFVGLNPNGGDNTVFLDQVVIN